MLALRVAASSDAAEVGSVGSMQDGSSAGAGHVAGPSRAVAGMLPPGHSD